MKIKAPPPGSIIAGKYRVEGMIGVGGMGVVLSAVHQQLDQRVAIKVLLPEVSKHPEVLERFSREARAAAKIQGENVARVLDVGELEDGSPFMVMEYLEGRDLSQEVRTRGGLPPAEVAHWIVEACDAIAQAHAAKIVHRDLKPSNLFLARQPDGRSVVKVLDFGISKLVDPDAPALTKTSSIVGTPYYMSPEQLTAAKTVDTRADIWALGVIMYELLASAPPFYGESMPEVVAAILQNQPRPIASIRTDVPDALCAVIGQCIQTKPDDRLQNVAAVAAALAPFGFPADQERAERIARVLRVSHVPDGKMPDTELAPRVVTGSSTASPTSPTKTMPLPSSDNAGASNPLVSPSAHSRAAPPVNDAPMGVSDPPPSPQLPRPGDATMSSASSKDGGSAALAKSVAAITTPATPAPAERSRFMSVAIVAGIAVLVGGGAFIGLSSRQTKGDTSLGDAATSQVLATNNNNVAPSTAPLASSAPTALLTPIVPSASASASSHPTTTTTAATTRVTTRPSASAAPVAASASAAPATTASSKNPLDMVIK